MIIRGSYGHFQGKELLPAPQIKVNLGNPSTGRIVECNAIFDTAASMTCIPSSAVKEFSSYREGLVLAGETDASGAFTRSVSSNIYVVTVQFEHINLELEAVEIPRPYMLIGRDILNLLRASYNGPESKWEKDNYVGP